MSRIRAMKRRLGAVLVVATLLLSGCAHLGPAPSMPINPFGGMHGQ